MPNDNPSAKGRVIAIEGLACVGKTTLVEKLATEIPGCVVVPETFPDILRLVCDAGPFGGAFYLNDLHKGVLCSRHAGIGRTVILDRYFVSTIAHHLAARTFLIPNDLLGAYAQNLVETYYAAIPHPDIWVYLNADANAAWDRYRKIRDQDLSSQWATLDGTIRIQNAMELCLRQSSIVRGSVLEVQSSADLAVENVISLLEQFEKNKTQESRY